MAIDFGCDAQRSTAVHGVLRVQEEVEKDLLQLAGVAEDGREVGLESGFEADLRGLELVLEQGQCVANDCVHVDVGELGAAGAREVQQAVDDFRRAEGLLGDLFEQRASRSSPRTCLVSICV